MKGLVTQRFDSVNKVVTIGWPRRVDLRPSRALYLHKEIAYPLLLKAPVGIVMRAR